MINHDNLSRLQGGRFGNVEGTEQVELAAPVEQVGLSLDPAQQRLLVTTAHKGDAQPSRQRPQTHLGQTLEGQNSLIVGDGPAWLEGRTHGLVTLEHLDSFGDGTNGHLCRQPKALADSSIGNSVQVNLTEVASSETLLGSEVGCRVEGFHRAQKVGLLCFTGQEL